MVQSTVTESNPRFFACLDQCTVKVLRFKAHTRTKHVYLNKNVGFFTEKVFSTKKQNSIEFSEHSKTLGASFRSDFRWNLAMFFLYTWLCSLSVFLSRTTKTTRHRENNSPKIYKYCKSQKLYKGVKNNTSQLAPVQISCESEHFEGALAHTHPPSI